MSQPLADVIHHALTTDHAALAQTAGAARKYPANIAPFAAIASEALADPRAMADLHSLLLPGESTWLLNPADPAQPPPPRPGLLHETTLPCFQMTFPATAPLPAPNPAHQLHRLTCADAPAMVALTELAFPGFFRHRTCLMGNYYGIFQAEANGRQLIAMGGERLCFSSEPCDENPLGHHYRELSGICTHPAHRGQGHAATIMAQLLQDHRSANQLSFLHTGTANPAAALYHRLGLLTTRTIHLHRLLRTP